MSNFSFIEHTELNALREDVLEAEQQVYQAPMYAAMLCRKALEKSVRWLYEHDPTLEVPYDDSLSALMHDYRFKQLVGPQFAQVNLIRKTGNLAVHGKFRTKSEEALFILKKLHGFLGWIALMYTAEKVSVPHFDSSLVPKLSESDKSKKQLQQLEAQFQESQSEIERLKAELERFQAIKQQNERVVPAPVDLDEAETRARYIDILLMEAGWDPHGVNVREFAVTGMPKRGGGTTTGYVDYVLWGDDGKPLAVVEAKRTTKNAKEGRTQARLYADCLEQAYGQRPVIFYTNGYEIWLWDDLEYPERLVLGYYTKDELQQLIHRRKAKQSLDHELINTKITERPYQREAIKAVTEEFARGNRKCLLVMATGTGKTRTAASLAELLSKAGWVKRVLFLADRVELVRQAKKAFNDHLPDYASVNLMNEKESEGSRIVFSTYPTIRNLINEKNEADRFYGIGHFDLIIFDEIHRSIYDKYKAILQYFDGLKVGLTATPRGEESQRDTYALFDLEPNNPTFAYELPDAVQQQWLVPYRGIGVPTKFYRGGIKYDELTPEEQNEYEQEFADPGTGEVPDLIAGKDLDDWLFNEDTANKVLAYVMENGRKIESGDRLGKTIVFARNQKHADFLKTQFEKQYPELGGSFCEVITYRDKFTSTLIDDFKAKRDPAMAISVDMLDTGVDVPEVVNLVIYKPVKSKVKFLQMLGRGTRLCEDLFGPGEHKVDFLVFDLCENFEFFEMNPQGIERVVGKSLSQRLFEARLLLSQSMKNEAEPSLRAFAEDLREELIQLVRALNEENINVRMHLRAVEKYKDPHNWTALQDHEMKELVKDIAPLVVEHGVHEMTKRFDLLAYQLMYMIHTDAGGQEVVKDKIMETAERLSRKGSIPQVAKKMDVLRRVSQEAFWEDLPIPEVDHVRCELRDLMVFLDKNERPVAYTNFVDELGQATEHEVEYQSLNLSQYRKRVEQYIRENRHQLVIDKLHRNLPITTDEVQELEEHLFTQGDLKSREDFENAYGGEPLLKFVRRIVGMDVAAANAAFSEFLDSGSLNSKQIRFIQTIINYLTVNGTIDPDKLFESPFTDVDAGGMASLFRQNEVDKIRQIIAELNGMAG